MKIATVLILVGLAGLLRLTARWRARRWLVYGASILCLYALQPGLAVRGLAYWLPTLTLALTIIGWLLTSEAGRRWTRENIAAGGLALALALLVGMARYVDASWLFEAIPPPLAQTAAGLGLLAFAAVGLALAMRNSDPPAWAMGLAITILIAVLIMLKTPSLTVWAAGGLRALAGQNPGLATALDLRWLGFSYIAFRLVHTLRDRQDGRLPVVSLVDYASYVTFFPALLAGPIDRLERFEKDFNQAPGEPGDITWQDGLRRVFIGLVKKFAVADTLALVALGPENAIHIHGAGWMWLVLYFYALQIYFDFSGYTDIAIGAGLLLGVRLPENFSSPYLKPNLTLFWNAWHMSLTQWFRAYFFNPLVRRLRSLPRRPGPGVTMLITQLATFTLIGLWHGVTLNFVLWGLWHGVGLFIQSRWSERTRAWFAARKLSQARQRVLKIASWLLTFHYIALGWVFFVLPGPDSALRVFAVLFGVQP